MDAGSTRKIVGSGSGKLILFGEHAVVYGKPAIVAGLNRGAQAWVAMAPNPTLEIIDGMTGNVHAKVSPDPDGDELERAFNAWMDTYGVDMVAVNVTVDLPMGAGLGSSAALAAAVCRALAQFVGKEKDVVLLEQAVSASEDIFHGMASGIDQAAALGGGVFEYQRDLDGEKTITSMFVKSVRFAVCRAGRSAPTSEMVDLVAQHHIWQPDVSAHINNAIAEIVRAAKPALAQGDWKAVGELMNLNHGLLAAFGVSTLKLDHACHVAREAGAYGAKLTGAGGGGCVFALYPDDPEKIVSAWKERGWDAFSIEIS